MTQIEVLIHHRCTIFNFF